MQFTSVLSHNYANMLHIRQFRIITAGLLFGCSWLLRAETGDGLSNIFALDTRIEVQGSLQDSLLAAAVPFQFIVFQNVPASDDTSTTIRFALPVKGRVAITVQNVSGQTVRTLPAMELPAGVHQCVWDGRNDNGRRVAAGVYRCIIRCRNNRVVKAVQLRK